MGSHYALLVLSEPPQSTAWEDLQLALLPTIHAVIARFLHRPVGPGVKTYLDVALPVSRIVDDAESFSGIVSTVEQILTGIYQLLGVALQTHAYSYARYAGQLEATIIPVYERRPIDPGDHEALNNPRVPLPLAIQDLEVFARSSRGWSRIYQVDSPQGDRVYRKLRNVVGTTIPTVLHERVERLPAGIQMYIPRSSKAPATGRGRSISNGHINSDQVSVVRVENGSLAISDKVQLTFAFMVLEEEHDRPPREQEPPAKIEIVTQGETRGKAVVLEFLISLLGCRFPELRLQLEEKGQRPCWKTMLDNNIVLTVCSAHDDDPTHRTQERGSTVLNPYHSRDGKDVN